jgi:glucose/arabinose dehydrogenase
MRMRGISIPVALSALWLSTEARGQTCPAIELQPILGESVPSPVFVTHAGDGTGRLFIVEQGGAIKVLQPGSDSPTLFLRIPDSKVLSGGERGLLGLAFHPSFSSNRRFFVYYTNQANGGSVIAEYQASAVNPDVADPTATTATETVILTFSQPYSNHNGGSLAFGPDGYLYIASGDGGSANDPGNRAQNVDTLLGKILRIDVDTPDGSIPYSSPVDNPYAGAIPGLDPIYTIGMRNPWRMSFDRLTGELLAGDVGQGSREEVDLVALGGNYGWRVMEGTRCNIASDPLPCNSQAFTPPALEYTHTAGRCAVTGGYVYRGTAGALPQGTYVYGDYCSGEIFGADVDDLPLDPAALPVTPTLLLNTTGLLSSFGEDEDGEIYAVDRGGQVLRLLAAVRISPTSAAFDENGGGGSVEVTSPAACPGWTAASNDPWIAITSGGSGTGNGTVGYSVEANPDVSPRSGTLTIAGLTFALQQAGGPAPVLSIDDVTVTEGPGAEAAFTVTLSFATSETVTVSYSTAPGSAAGGDFASALGQLVFDPGETSKPVIVGINDDLLDEDDETFFVNLSGAVNAALGDAQGEATIEDDDPMPALAISDATFAEGFGVRRVPFLLTLDVPSGRPVSVDYTIGAGTATPGVEFREATGAVSFAPGETRKRIYVWAKGDRADEADETFFVDLQGPTNATLARPQGVGTILDDDPAPRSRTTP